MIEGHLGSVFKTANRDEGPQIHRLCQPIVPGTSEVELRQVHIPNITEFPDLRLWSGEEGYCAGFAYGFSAFLIVYETTVSPGQVPYIM